MWKVGKKVLSSYMRSDCRRRLLLELFDGSPTQRQHFGFPDEYMVRPGLAAITDAGNQWQEQVLRDLNDAFGSAALLGQRTQNQGVMKFQPSQLSGIIGNAIPGRLLVEAQFALPALMQQTFGLDQLTATYGLRFDQVRPDIILVNPPGTASFEALPDGKAKEVDAADNRVVLQVVDIKLSSEVAAPYLVEVAYYAMALSAWLQENGHNNQFMVSADCAVWPGSHEGSKLRQCLVQAAAVGVPATHLQMREAMGQDLQVAPYDVVSARIVRFLRDELSATLAIGAAGQWQNLPWHVDNRCISCRFLGYQWTASGQQPHTEHCYIKAQAQEHLSRIPFVTRGAGRVLAQSSISSVSQVAQLAAPDPIFGAHQQLRATRTIVPARALVLSTPGATAIIPQNVGTSASMPSNTSVAIHLTADFDISSALTLSFGIGVAAPNLAQMAEAAGEMGRKQALSGHTVYVVRSANTLEEQTQLFAALRRISEALAAARQTDTDADVQLYIWDSLTFDHIVRVIGRHLPALLRDQSLKYLAWLFPPPQLMPNADLEGVGSPITILGDVVQAMLAAPVAHCHTSLQVARTYFPQGIQNPQAFFNVPWLFEDPFSDQVPSERAHEIWTAANNLPGGRTWVDRVRELQTTVEAKLRALSAVRQRLQFDLRGQLNVKAPKIASLKVPTQPQRASAHGVLLFQYASLNATLNEIDVAMVQSWPPHTREARLRSARLHRRLSGQEEISAKQAFNVAGDPNIWIYEMRQESREAKFRDGDFTVTLSPERQSNFLRMQLERVGGAIPGCSVQDLKMPMHVYCGVTIHAIDRSSLKIALRLEPSKRTVLEWLENNNCADFSRDVIIDPKAADFFTKKLKKVLAAIGNPPSAGRDSRIVDAVGGQMRNAASTQETPVSEVLWSASNLYNTSVSRNLVAVRQQLAGQNAAQMLLDDSQWHAWEAALTKRLSLIWGPPGTGKSRTLTYIVLGAIIDAALNNRPIRVLISGPTYEAIDNVLEKCEQHFAGHPLHNLRISRLRSAFGSSLQGQSRTEDIVVGTGSACAELRARLSTCSTLEIVGGTPQQIAKLSDTGGSALSSYFDLIIIDEASQTDVANATLILSSLAAQGSVVVAGDYLQLSPIHLAEPPEGLENVVGQFFEYLLREQQVPMLQLNENYRSRTEIVEFLHRAGYSQHLFAHSPNICLRWMSPLPIAAPAGWPSPLPWSSSFTEILDPQRVRSAFVYSDGLSGQWNDFEANLIAAMIWLLRQHLSIGLDNMLGWGGQSIPMPPLAIPDDQWFWEKCVGVVTPHRAQQGLIIAKLQSLFPAVDPYLIRDAVDTVERFQGGQRDVIFASMAVGDPDTIAQEEEFLGSLNRFNVLVSRARAKIVVLCSQELMDHLPAELEVLQGSRLLKAYCGCFGGSEIPLSVPSIVPSGTVEFVQGTLRW